MKVGVDKFGREKFTFSLKPNHKGYKVGYFIVSGKTFQLTLFPPRDAQRDESQSCTFYELKIKGNE
jgi:hypothetical protein